jgi:hypothetical protein
MQNLSSVCGVVEDSGYAMAVLPDSPTAYWQMQETSGLPQDTSGNGHHMTSSVSTLEYRKTGALTSRCDVAMTGISGGGLIPTARVNSFSTAVDDITIEFWLYGPLQAWAKGGGWPFIIKNGSTWDGWDVRIPFGFPSYPHKFQIAMPNPTTHVPAVGTASSTYSTADWLHIVIVRTSGTWDYYVNGAIDTASASTATPAVPGVDGASHFDVYYDYYDYYSDSFATPKRGISHVAYYESALTSTQIADHYAAR